MELLAAGSQLRSWRKVNVSLVLQPDKSFLGNWYLRAGHSFASLGLDSVDRPRRCLPHCPPVVGVGSSTAQARVRLILSQLPGCGILGFHTFGVPGSVSFIMRTLVFGHEKRFSFVRRRFVTSYSCRGSFPSRLLN